jgi:hypothetical protein
MCIAGEELFIGDTAQEAVAAAMAAHPDDNGRFFRYIPKKNLPSIYGNMEIRGEWYACNDGVVRPILRGEVLAASGNWEPVEFLADVGADRTVLTAPLFHALGWQASDTDLELNGLGGTTRH